MRQKNLRKAKGQIQQWGKHFQNRGRNDGDLDLGDGSDVREKEMGLRAFKEVEPVVIMTY